MKILAAPIGLLLGPKKLIVALAIENWKSRIENSLIPPCYDIHSEHHRPLRSSPAACLHRPPALR